MFGKKPEYASRLIEKINEERKKTLYIQKDFLEKIVTECFEKDVRELENKGVKSKLFAIRYKKDNVFEIMWLFERDRIYHMDDALSLMIVKICGLNKNVKIKKIMCSDEEMKSHIESVVEKVKVAEKIKNTYGI